MSESPKNGTFDPAASFSQYFEAIPNMHTRLLREMVAFNQEAMTFVQKRVAADMEASGKLMACKTPMEAAEVMREFYDDAFKAYSAQALQFVNLSRSLGQPVSVEDETNKPTDAQ